MATSPGAKREGGAVAYAFRLSRSALQAVRRYCLDSCVGCEKSPAYVKECRSACCYLWPYRFRQMPHTALKNGRDVDPDNHPETKAWRTGPRHSLKTKHEKKGWVPTVQAIRWHCLECVESSREVERCSGYDCPLWPWRFGMRPETAAKKGKVVDPAEFVGSEDEE